MSVNLPRCLLHTKHFCKFLIASHSYISKKNGKNNGIIVSALQECDINLDGEIDREEFVSFIKRLTAGAFVTISQGLILTLVVAPTVAMATKKATEGVPGVGKVVQKLPNSIYASIVTLAVVLLQKSLESKD